MGRRRMEYTGSDHKAIAVGQFGNTCDFTLGESRLKGEWEKIQSHIREGAGFEQIVMLVAKEFINIDTEQIDVAIEATLAVVGEFTGSDRVYVDYFDSYNGVDNLSYQWVSRTEYLFHTEVVSLSYDQYPWWRSLIDSGKPIIVKSLADMPAYAVHEKEFYDQNGIKSNLEVKLSNRDREFGLFGLVTVECERIWQDSDLNLVQTLGELIASALYRKNTEEKKKKKASFDALTVQIASELMNCGIGRLDSVINESLGRLCNFLEADRSYVYLIDDQGFLDLTGEWHLEGFTSKSAHPLDGPYNSYVWWSEMAEKRGNLCFASLDELPEHAKREYEYYQLAGIYSKLEINMYYSGNLFGLMGFETVKRECRWESEFINGLELLSEIFAGALKRSEYEKQLLYKNELEGMLNKISSHFINIDFDNLEMAVISALKDMCKVIGTDRGYLNFYDSELQVERQGYIWADSSIKSPRPMNGEYDFKRFPWWSDNVASDKATVFSSLDELPDYACRERAWYSSCNIRSVAELTLHYQGKVFGFLGTESMKAEKKWTENELSIIQLVGEILIGGLLRSQSESDLEYMSCHDMLTGLFNRSWFDKKLEECDAEEYLPLSVIEMDVNGLRLINHSLGRERGDQLLATVSDIIRENCRKDDIPCRWGGGEMIILMPNTGRKEASVLANRIRNSCFNSGRQPFSISVSYGISTREDMSKAMGVILKESEERLSQSKMLEMSSVRSSIIASLQKTLAEKTHETVEHSERLREYTELLVSRLNLPESLIDELKLLSSLHDIGKIAVSEDILMKPGKLDESEWEMVRKHPETGYRIAASAPELKNIAEGILSHHERWDGAGYPRSLAGEDIPLVARIISIVDTFDVLVNGRSYKQPISIREALLEIERCAGGQFDPVLARLFADVVRTENQNI